MTSAAERVRDHGDKDRVPIVPTVSIGAQESQLFLTRGTWLSHALGLPSSAEPFSDIMPLTFGFRSG